MRNSKKRILLVEDESLIALAEKMVLERSGFEVITARSGEEAVNLTNEGNGFHLVLMDINLGPGMEGTQAAELILARNEVPVVFLSSHTEPEVVEKVEGITSYGYIVKNTGDTVLLASIRMAFRLYEVRKELRIQNQNLLTMLEVSRSLSSTLNLQTILQTASDRMTELTGLDTAAIYLLNDATISLTATTPPLPANFPENLRDAPLTEHPHIGRTIEHAAPVLICDVSEEVLTPAEDAVVKTRGLRSILYVPLVSRERVIGVYITGSTGEPAELTESLVELCMTLANITAVAAENAMLVNHSA